MRLLRSALLLALGCFTPTLFAQSATTTTLTITSAGTPVTASREGTVITLTATVLSGGAPVKTGQVNFCEVSAAPLQCTDIRLLGSVQLNSTGTAVYSFFPGPGAHTYQAVFLGTHAAASSASISSTLSVSPYYPTTTTLTSSGAPGNYSLTATVTASGGSIPPTGSIAFMDTSNTNYVLATASPLVPGPPTFGLHLAPAPRFPGNTSTGNNGSKVAITDLNGDGKLDVALADEGDAASTAALLGNEDGTFTLGPKVPPIGQAVALAVAVADFNGDGKPDIAASAQSPGRSIIETQIFLGNGDGTFTVGQTLPVGGAPIIATGDFNGDGIPDIIVESATTTQLSILLGNGDGTFTSQLLAAASSFPDLTEIAVGDLNADGIPDLALANQDGTVEILLSNGDGTFRTTGQTLPQLPIGIDGIAIADFDRDGKPDLVVLSPTGVSLLRGNGTGTFAPPTPIYTLPSSDPNALQSIAVGDFNGDGIADVVIGSSDFVRVLLGNGDGTFASPFEYPISGLGGIIAAADLNGDGLDDITFVGAGETLLSEVGTQSASATISGISVIGTGAHQVDASYSGDAVYQPSTAAAIPLTAQPVSTTLTLTANPTTSNLGQSVTLTATVSPTTPQQNHLPGGTVTFTTGPTIIGTATVVNGVATFSTTLLPIGTDTITATYSGDPNFTTSTATTTENVLGNTSATTLAVTPNPSFVGQTVTLTATVAQVGTTYPNLPTGTVSFFDGATQIGQATLDATGHATFTTSTLAIGSHTLTAAYAGDAAYYSSKSSATTLVVNILADTTALAVSPNPAGLGQTVTLTAAVVGTGFGSSTTPTGPVVFHDGATTLGQATLDATGHATFTTSTLTLGAHTLSATYAGSPIFSGSASATVTEIIVKPDFTITLSSPTITLATYQHTTTTVTLTSIGAFADSIAIACANPPTYVTCIFTPQSATLTANGTTAVSFYLDTDSIIGGANGPLHSSRTQPPSAINFAWLLSPFSLFAALRFRRRNKSRRTPLLLLVILALPIALGITSCGGSQITPVPSAAPGTYAITIAASGATTGVTHTAQLTLIVTP